METNSPTVSFWKKNPHTAVLEFDQYQRTTLRINYFQMMREMGSMTGMNMGGRQLTPSDFKTISSPDLIHFLITIEQYDYNRQAALYPVVLGTTRFLIIGVQKKAGPLRGNEVWRVELTNTPGLIEQGRKKDNTLLRHHARQAHPLRQDAAPFETAAPLGQAA